jgi:hypothetical protein
VKRFDIVRDLAGLAGCGLVSYGTGQVYEPAGFIVAGLMLIAGAIATARRA